MSSSLTITPTTHVSSSVQIAHMLIQYAEADSAFASMLRAAYQHTAETSPNAVPAPISRYLVPKTEESAARLLSHFSHRALHAPESEYRQAETLLARWAKNDLDPKNLIFGVVGVDIIGPTLGLVQSKKKKRCAMHLIIDAAHYQTLDKKALSELVQRGSGAQFATELRTANGTALLLYPDTADWCFSDHLVEIFTESYQTLCETEHILNDEKLPYTPITEHERTVGVVLSPQIDEAFVRDRGSTRI